MSEDCLGINALDIGEYPKEHTPSAKLGDLTSSDNKIVDGDLETMGKEAEESSPLEDLSDDEVHEKYQHHPGYPRTAAIRKKYYKFVYPPNDASRGKRAKKPHLITDHEEYRRELRSLYQYFIFCWFDDDDWTRFPFALNKEEYERLDAELKNKFMLLCEIRKEEGDLDDTYSFLGNKLAWAGIVARYHCGQLAPGQLIPSRKHHSLTP